jgi:hypothetical protein
MQAHERSEPNMTTMQRFAKRLAAGLALICALTSAAGAATPLLLYTYSAGSGTTIADTSIGTAADVTATPGVSGAWDTSLGANKTGYNFASTATSVSGSLSGTKVQTALAGLQTVTVEMVIDSAQASNTYDGFLKLADGSDTALFGVTINQGQGGLIFSAGEGNFPNDCAIKYAIPTSGVYVLTVVVDSTQATAANRVLVYVNGTVQTPTILDQLGLNVALDSGVNWSTVVLRMGEAGASPQGKNYYTAVYASALASGTVSANATVLASNNDADPNAASSPTFFGDPPGMWMMARSVFPDWAGLAMQWAPPRYTGIDVRRIRPVYTSIASSGFYQ